jgi:LPS export ABC transporter protein LptC
MVLILASGCGDPKKERRSPETGFIGLNHPVQESWRVRLALTESGKQREIIEAGHGAEYSTSSGSEQHLDHGIRLTLFDTNGHSGTFITARTALIHDNQDIEAQGNVIITSGGTVITTEYVKRTAKDKMIRSNKFVTITRAGDTIRGEGFESDQALKKYRIFRGSGEAFTKQ